MARSLLVLAGTLPGAVVAEALAASPAATTDVTASPASCSGSGYAAATLLATALDAGVLGGLAKLLAPGATLALQLHGPGHTANAASTALLLAGFADCSAVQSSSSSDSIRLSARLPNFAVGSRDSIRRKPKPAAAAPAAPAPVAWTLAGDDLDGEELVDDEELLTEEDRQRPAAASKADDCEVGAGGARKACANCSCGRAEAEARGEKVTLTQDMLDNPQSSCGNCSLGDAFRCAGCPYRGLPAFEPGKPISLPSDFLTADA